MDDYVIDGDLVFSDQSSALKFYREQYHKKKEWQGLTDEERHSLPEWKAILKELGPVWAPMMIYLYIRIEAKLKEKNG